MRTFIFFLAISFFSCCGTKPVNTLIKDSEKNNTYSFCPEDGKCNFELLSNKSLELKYDTTGKLYPKINNGEKIVLKFEYKRDDIYNVEDDSYVEQIFMELNQENISINLEQSDLQKVKLLFARLCFCRGQTGYYKIEEGALNITSSSKDHYQLELNFTVDQVPHVIKSVTENFKL